MRPGQSRAAHRAWARHSGAAGPQGLPPRSHLPCRPPRSAAVQTPTSGPAPRAKLRWPPKAAPPAPSPPVHWVRTRLRRAVPRAWRQPAQASRAPCRVAHCRKNPWCRRRANTAARGSSSQHSSALPRRLRSAEDENPPWSKPRQVSEGQLPRANAHAAEFRTAVQLRHGFAGVQQASGVEGVLHRMEHA